MGKKNKLHWREIDSKRVADLARRVNTKINRIAKNAPPSIVKAQPNKINSKALQEELKGLNRQQFNRVVKRYERYLKKGAENPYTTKSGVLTTKWQKREIEIQHQSINKYKANELKKYKPSPYEGNMGSIERNSLRPKQNNMEAQKKSDWSTYVHNVESTWLSQGTSKNKAIYKDNVLRAISSELGNDEVWTRVSKIPADDLYDMFYYSRVLNIDFVYDPRDIDFIVENMLEDLNVVQGMYKEEQGEYTYLADRK